MTGIPEVRAQVDIVIETLQTNQEANQNAQSAHNEAISYGESVLTELGDTADVSAAAKELETARELGGTVTDVFAKIITGVERGLKAIDGVNGHISSVVGQCADISVRLKTSGPGYSGLHNNLKAARDHADNGRRLAKEASGRLHSVHPVEGSPLGIVEQNTQRLANEAKAYHDDVLKEANNTLKIRTGDPTRLEKIDSDLEDVIKKLTYASDKPLKDAREKIEGALRLLRQGVDDIANCSARLERPIEKLGEDDLRVTSLASDIQKVVTLLQGEKTTSTEMARFSAAIQGQAKEVLDNL